MKNLFLIRHGESMQNTKENQKILLPDHKVYLTENGIMQAEEAGEFLRTYIDRRDIDLGNSSLYVSPFKRTRDTAKIINGYLGIKEVLEDYLLVEHEYGLFSDKDFDVIKELFPEEWEYNLRFYNNEGSFYLRFPMGESPMDVAIRTRMFLNQLENNDKDNIFIVSHGTALKTLIMNKMHYSPEWYAHTPNLENCEIRLINEKNKMKTLRK